jgi:hypothetical protein
MLNSTIQLKVKQRLNKLDSQDYNNIQPWMIVEAFNKAQVDWCRRNLHGINIVKEGDEQSNRRIDDLEILLTSTPLSMNDRQIYYESNNKPGDYLQWKRVSAKGKTDCCPARPLVIYLSEQANVDEMLRDANKRPDFSWGETFATQKGGKIQIYTNDEFDIVDTELTYYRQPRRIEITGVKDPYTGLIPAVDVLSELKDDLVEVIIDETAKVIAGDIESFNQMQRNNQTAENNN